MCGFSDSRSACSSGHISPVAGTPVKTFRFQWPNSHMRFVATDLIIKEGFPDILRNFGHSLNVALTLLVALGIYTIAQRVSLDSDFPEGSGKESRRWQAGVDVGHILEQLRPLAAPVFVPGFTTIVLRVQLIQPCHNGIQLVLHRRGFLSECQWISRRARRNGEHLMKL